MIVYKSTNLLLYIINLLFNNDTFLINKQ